MAGGPKQIFSLYVPKTVVSLVRQHAHAQKMTLSGYVSDVLEAHFKHGTRAEKPNKPKAPQKIKAMGCDGRN